MALETAQDLLNFFDTDTHGTSASVSIDGTVTSISVILNEEYFAIAGESVDVDGTQPVVTCRSSDVSNIDTDDTIVINARTYNIVNIQPDGTGVTVLILQDQ
tara:strand:- start:46 stop:351 length:306 start_codon:yes stop_codon:yes gene_type:complete